MSLIAKIQYFFDSRISQKNIPISKLIAEWPPETLPLVDFQRKIGLVWSARSACSLSVFWYYAVTNQLEEAMRFDQWPHVYRTSILENMTQKDAKCSNLSVRDIEWIRVMRNPFKRAVSSFRHFIENSPEEAMVDAFLGGKFIERGASFEEFLKYVKTRDIKSCDIHFRQQWIDQEKFCPNMKIINADGCDLKSSLFSLVETDQKNFSLFEERQGYIFSNHVAEIKDFGGIDSKTIIKIDHIRDIWPGEKAFDNADTRALVREIYAEDYSRFKDHI